MTQPRKRLPGVSRVMVGATLRATPRPTQHVITLELSPEDAAKVEGWNEPPRMDLGKGGEWWRKGNPKGRRGKRA